MIEEPIIDGKPETIGESTVTSWEKSDPAHQYPHTLDKAKRVEGSGDIYEAPISTGELQILVKSGVPIVYDSQDFTHDTVYYDDETQIAYATQLLLRETLGATAQKSQSVSMTEAPKTWITTLSLSNLFS